MSFELVLSNPHRAMIMEPEPEGIPGESKGSCLSRRKSWRSHFIENVRDHMLQEQRKYQKRFKKVVRPTSEALHPGVFFFIRPSRPTVENRLTKLAPVADGPCEVA